MDVAKCPVHTEYFEDKCDECKKEYLEMKQGSTQAENKADLGENFDDYKIGFAPGKDSREQRIAATKTIKHYKDLTEDRARRLFEDVFVGYVKSGVSEQEAAQRAKGIVRKQCSMRGIQPWPWL